MDRKLIISLCADSSVDYLFQRNHKPLASYIVDHPAVQVVGLNATPTFPACHAVSLVYRGTSPNAARMLCRTSHARLMVSLV